MKKLKLVFVSILIPWYAFAWNGSGHMTAGAIAYYYLKANNPAIIPKVLATIKLHPWFNSKHWRDTLAMLPADQQEVGLFMLASTYPDDAKAIKNFPDGDSTHKMWHYVDFPFVVPGSNVTPLPPKTPNAKIKIDELMVNIPKEKDSPQKAVDLAWFFHLIEDIHQPLHTASLFDLKHPTGDAGGNADYIKLTVIGTVVLHSYWDGLVSGTVPQYAINAQQLLKKPKYKNMPELTANTTPDDWILKESFPDAKKYAYKNGKVDGLKTAPSVVSASYVSTSKALGERRVVLSGIRIAQLLIKFYSK